jgi:hypothetical protein
VLNLVVYTSNQVNEIRTVNFLNIAFCECGSLKLFCIMFKINIKKKALISRYSYFKLSEQPAD